MNFSLLNCNKPESVGTGLLSQLKIQKDLKKSPTINLGNIHIILTPEMQEEVYNLLDRWAIPLWEKCEKERRIL